MGRFYSPSGNYEVWDEKPAGYYTLEEWKALHPDPEPPEPTVDEKVAALDNQYETDKKTLASYYLDAALAGDTDVQDALRAEMAALNEQYDADVKALKGE